MCLLKRTADGDFFSDEELQYICEELQANPSFTDMTIRYGSASYFNRIKKVVRRDRIGEVVFCVIRPNGKIILTRCKNYPESIYRIPTGGIGHNERIIDAIFREVKEELGLAVKIRDFLGVIRIRFEHGDEHALFYSYIFILDEIGGRLLEDASDDEISEIKEVDVEQMEAIVGSLNEIKGKWHDWGKFRYITSNAVLRYLIKAQSRQN
jgi:ADP-ribose pyrophosphatase YjhB (NUDIX family)